MGNYLWERERRGEMRSSSDVLGLSITHRATWYSVERDELLTYFFSCTHRGSGSAGKEWVACYCQGLL